MASNEAEFAKQITQIAADIKRMASMDMFPRTNEDRNFESLVQKSEDIEKGQRENTKQMIKVLKETAEKNKLEINVDDFKDVLKFEDQTKAMNSIMTILSTQSDVQFDTKEELDATFARMKEQAGSAGLSLKKLGIRATVEEDERGNSVYTIKKYDKTLEKLTKETTTHTKVLSESTNETRKNNEKSAFFGKWLSKLGGTAKMIGKDFINLAEAEQRFAQQNATADAGWIDAVTELQITTIDYMKILKDTRVESLAMASAGIDFKESLKEGQQSLLRFTANSTEAAIVSKEFHKNVALMGVSQSNLGDAVLQQTDIYKKHYRVLGYSAEEFANLTQELVNDQGMRSTLLSLQEDERKAYIQGIQQRTAEYITMGYSIDRAKELQKTFQDIIGMNPKDRMKKAAKERAMMGAMGMGAEAAELFKLTTGLRTSKTREADQKRMTEIRSKASSKFGEMSGSQVSQGQAFSMQMIADATGFTEIANKFETESGKGRTVDAQSLELLKQSANKNNEISETSAQLLQLQNTWRAAAGTGVTSIITNLLSGFGSLVAVNTAGFAANVLATKGISLGKTGGALGKGIGKLAGAATLLYGAWELGNYAGEKILESIKEDADDYAALSMTVGRTFDHIADFLGNDSADQRIRDEDMRRAKQIGDTEALIELLKEQNELKRESMEEAAKSAGKQFDATQFATVNYEKIAAAQIVEAAIARRQKGIDDAAQRNAS